MLSEMNISKAEFVGGRAMSPISSGKAKLALIPLFSLDRSHGT